MTRDELLARLNSIEWTDIEFKEALWDVPKSALSTVSSFANTAGGHLVFGIKQENGAFSISGVVDADKVQNDFLGQVRDRNKISAFLPIDGQLHALHEGTVIVFFVREALLDATGYKQRPYFKAHHLAPLLAGGVLRMTVPDKPTSSRQQYVLTETGVKLKAMHGQTGGATEQESEQ